jgi:hypothetical protein
VGDVRDRLGRFTGRVIKKKPARAGAIAAVGDGRRRCLNPTNAACRGCWWHAIQRAYSLIGRRLRLRASRGRLEVIDPQATALAAFVMRQLRGNRSIQCWG